MKLWTAEHDAPKGFSIMRSVWVPNHYTSVDFFIKISTLIKKCSYKKNFKFKNPEGTLKDCLNDFQHHVYMVTSVDKKVSPI